ncbi:MAG TPA: hypothetical protein VMB83_12940 [Roseiarcus sp.]|nr:hypothetical protein [Roseiarcus sp.]
MFPPEQRFAAVAASDCMDPRSKNVREAGFVQFLLENLDNQPAKEELIVAHVNPVTIDLEEVDHAQKPGSLVSCAKGWFRAMPNSNVVASEATSSTLR